MGMLGLRLSLVNGNSKNAPNLTRTHSRIMYHSDDELGTERQIQLLSTKHIRNTKAEDVVGDARIDSSYGLEN